MIPSFKLLANRFFQTTSLVMVFVVTLLAFPYCYGFASRMFFWAALFFTLAFLLRHRAKRFSMFVTALVLCGLLLWPIDASLRFPVLRKLYDMTPFGPFMEVYPSPSGHCVAYFYDHGFADRAYEVRFAHGLGFPEERHWIPDGNLLTVRMEPRWNSGSFTVEVEGLGVTFIYDEKTRTVTLPKGP